MISDGIHYVVHGTDTSSPPVLLTHGFGASGEMWAPNLTAFGDRRVITWDMRGHARSDGPDEPNAYGVKRSIEDMVRLLDVVGGVRAVLGGISLGGYLSLAFHARHPERVSALMLIGTGPGFRREEPRARWNEFAEAIAVALERDGLGVLPRGAELGEHRSTAGVIHTARRVMAQDDAHVIESLETISVPTLVIVGEQDTNLLQSAHYMAGRIRGARLVTIPGAGHAANLDAPAPFNAAVREFMENL